jgi:hypothetical protein
MSGGQELDLKKTLGIPLESNSRRKPCRIANQKSKKAAKSAIDLSLRRLAALPQELPPCVFSAGWQPL